MTKGTPGDEVAKCFVVKRHLSTRERLAVVTLATSKEHQKEKESKRSLAIKQSKAQRERQAGEILQRENRSIDKTCLTQNKQMPAQQLQYKLLLRQREIFILGDDPMVKGKAWDDWLDEIVEKKAE